ncbi:hypothetical protein LINPERPRIM_LOCUS4318 [Linum perenne]
MNSLSKSCLV